MQTAHANIKQKFTTSSDNCVAVLERIVESHRDASACERVYLGEPRSVDAKATYPENQYPIW